MLSSNSIRRERSALVSNAIYRTTALMMNNLGTDLIEISSFTKIVGTTTFFNYRDTFLIT
ncbi:hypothetical protein LEP1GSC065_2247 [Leptospira kirschneri serovar Sokoine str. RM1]|nr:hypothetical protein LEP1GSC065_2247 [Leptospira kirschneri serovar Sokoine str. RM1]